MEKRNVIIISMILILLLMTTGCAKKENFKKDVANTLSIYEEDVNEFSNFFKVYEAHKYGIKEIYVQAGIDNYTNTYLLETMPSIFSTLIKSTNKYDMQVYALLNNEAWLNKNDIVQEVDNVLKFNKQYKEERFKGINIDVNLDNLNENQLNNYYNNLKQTREIIENHNKENNDNLKLIIKVNNKMNEFIDLADKVIINYEDKEILNNENDVKVLIELEEIKTNRKFINKLENMIEEFNQYDNYDGIVIKDYESYIEVMKNLNLIVDK